MTIKDEIIQKALDLFAEEGYENTGVQKIVDEIGITKPTLYHHFGNKEGLLRSILETYGWDFLNLLRKQVAYQQDIIFTLEALAIFYLRQAQLQPIYYRLSKNLHYSPLGSESHRIISQYDQEELLILKDLFERIALHHTGLKDKSTILAYTFRGHLDAFITYHIEEEDLELVSEEEGRKLAKQFLYGVFS